MPQNDYSKIELIVNWNDDPATSKTAKQVIYSTVSAGLPDGDYNVYIGKVIEKIYVNKFRQVVICLRKPQSEDLSEANLDRKPLTTAQPPATTPETITKPYTTSDIVKLKSEIVTAERKARAIYGDR